MPFDELSHSIGLLIRDVMCAVLDEFDLNICAPMRPQCIGEAWHEVLERRVFARSEYQRHSDGALLRRIEFLIRRKGPIDLQRRTQMFGSGICPGVACDIRIAESIGIEKMTQINGFATGKELLRQARRLLKIHVPSDGIGFNRIPRPKAWQRCVKHHHPAARLRITTGEGVCNHATDIVPDHVNVLQRSEEHTSELQSPVHLVCRLLLEKKKTKQNTSIFTKKKKKNSKNDIKHRKKVRSIDNRRVRRRRVLFFFNDTATTEIYTLSLHDALPI